MVYTDTFVDEEDRVLLRPEKFLVNKGMHDSFVELDELRKPTWRIQGGNGSYYGQTIITKDMSADWTRNRLTMNMTKLIVHWTSGANLVQRKYGRDYSMSGDCMGTGSSLRWQPPIEFKDNYMNGNHTPKTLQFSLVECAWVCTTTKQHQATRHSASMYRRTARPGAKGNELA